MKQSLILVIIVSLLVLTIQTVTQEYPITTTTYNGRCPKGYIRDSKGICIPISKKFPSSRHTSINSHKCPKGKFYMCKK